MKFLWHLRVRHTCGTALLTLALLMSACGGGGGGSDAGADDGGGVVSAPPRAPLADLSQDVLPQGDRIDRRASDYFAYQVGNIWTYDSTNSLGGAVIEVRREVGASTGGDVDVTEFAEGDAYVTTWRRTAEGLVRVEALADSGEGVGVDALPSLLEYAEPFYAPGAERRLIRQGSLRADLTGDGLHDSYRLEYAQVLVGFETVQLPSGPLTDVAHFLNVTSILFHPSDGDLEPFVVVSTEHAWWAPGIGLVRAERSVADGQGVASRGVETMVLKSGLVRGERLFQPPPDGRVTTLQLPHRALVYDAARHRYYASVPGSVAPGGNSIAIIDAVTGQLTAKVAIGAEPSALALSADGSVLHVGLDGSADVLGLSLPDMRVVSRTRLPVIEYYGQTLADTIAVSPLDPGLVAVALRGGAGGSPRHAGVALIRDGVLQPLVTPSSPSNTLLVFDGQGTAVYGFNNESTERGLRRLDVLADGVREAAMVTAQGGKLGTRHIDLTPDGLLLGTSLYSEPDLRFLGEHEAAGGQCRWHPASARVVCLGVIGGGEDRFLTVADPRTFAILATPVFQRGYQSGLITQIVPGPRGQVALSFGSGTYGVAYTTILLFTTPALE